MQIANEFHSYSTMKDLCHVRLTISVILPVPTFLVLYSNSPTLTAHTLFPSININPTTHRMNLFITITQDYL